MSVNFELLWSRRIGIVLCILGGLCFAQPSKAAEYGVSNYLLGLVFPLSGYTPPPGVYFRDTFYLYRGSFTNSNLETTYNFLADIGIAAWYPDFEIFGAAPGFAATVPYVGVRNSFDATMFDQDGSRRAVSKTGSANSLGDTQYSAILGWHAGEHHWNVTLTAFMPTGYNAPNLLAVTGLNRPALDVKGAYTFLGLSTGIEVSGMLGMTFNAINTTTDYRTGTELHFEWAVHQHFPFGLYAGVTGFIYQQLTDDTGLGAIYGPYRGRVFAVGPAVGYTFKVDAQEVRLAGRWYHEFGAQNRPQGDAIFASLTFRL